MASTTTNIASGNDIIDGLITGFQWAVPASPTPFVVTYSFPTAASQLTGSGYGGAPGSGSGSETQSFSECTTAQKDAYRAIFALFALIFEVDFHEITETDSTHSDMRVSRTGENVVPGAAAWTYPVGGGARPGDIWIKTGGSADSTMRHANESAAIGDPVPSNRDFIFWCIMSNRTYEGEAAGNHGEVSAGHFPMTLGYGEVLALRYMYGGAKANPFGAGSVHRVDPTTGAWIVDDMVIVQSSIAKTLFTLIGGATDSFDKSDFPGATLNLSAEGITTLDSGLLVTHNTTVAGNMISAGDFTAEAAAVTGRIAGSLGLRI
jgi:hypothetical protein